MTWLLVVLWALGVAATGYLSTMAGVRAAQLQLGHTDRASWLRWTGGAVVVCSATVVVGLAAVW